MSDLSRVEQLLRNALGEDIYEVTPQSRVEALLVELNELIEGISTSVDPEELTPIITAWLAENIHDGAVVDASLSVAGAAAESKKTGEEINQLKEDLDDIVSTEYSSSEINKNSSILTFTESTYAGNAGYVASQQYDSWSFTVETDCTIYLQSIGTGTYMQMCVYPSGAFNDPNYVRYRNSDNNLPTQSSPLALTSGTLVIISTNKSNATWSFQLVGGIASKTLLNQNIHLSDSQINQVKDALCDYGYDLSYVNGVLTVNGNGIDCAFSDLDFNNCHGVFELQNLTYNGDSVSARTVSIYVESTISTDEFKRYTIWALNDGKMTVSTVLKTLKDLQIDYVFGCGIISCQDDASIAWVNKQMLTAEVLIGLNENTAIVTTGGTLVSKRLSVNSDYGDHRVAFNVYSGRKKLYYYTCYGSDIAVPSGANFASCAELEFL